jgi:hypothetical protein
VKPGKIAVGVLRAHRYYIRNCRKNFAEEHPGTQWQSKRETQKAIELATATDSARSQANGCRCRLLLFFQRFQLPTFARDVYYVCNDRNDRIS